MPPKVDVRRASERFVTQTDWLLSYHSFSFGVHYDPANIRHGLLVVNNDDIIQPGRGFGPHPHNDMEIVTWVLEGELEHKDSTGGCGIIYPGLAQRMSAGRGIIHSEMNPSSQHTVHLIQMWVLPDKKGIDPSYEQADVSRELESGDLVPVASGRRGQGAISLSQRGATLWVGRLKPNTQVNIPEAPFIHLFIARGGAILENGVLLSTGDAVRLTDSGALKLTADATSGAEILLWEMHL